MTTTWVVSALVCGALLSLAGAVAERGVARAAVGRRWVWAASLAASLLLPVLAWWRPAALGGLTRLTGAAATVAGLLDGTPWSPLGAGATAPVQGGAAPAAPWLFGALWLAASCGLLAALAWTQRRLWQLQGECERAEVDGTTVLVSRELGPAVLGLLRPAIVLPRWAAALPAEQRRMIVAHEREHIAAGDTWLLLLASVAVALMPWNAPLWWQHRRLRLAVEQDCDGRVLRRGAHPLTYGQVLLQTAVSRPVLTLAAPFRSRSSTHLEKRIMAITTELPARSVLPALPWLLAAAVLTGAAWAIAAGPASALPAAAGASTPRFAVAGGGPKPATAAQRELPGYTRIEAAEGGRVRVRLEEAHGTSLVLLSSQSVTVDRAGDVVEFTTPAELLVTAAPGFIISFIATGTDAGARLRLETRGGDGFAFRRVSGSAQRLTLYQDETGGGFRGTSMAQ